MFKKKGSSTNVAIVCSLICAALGVYYGLSSKSSTPAVAPVLQAEHAAEGAALNAAAAAVNFSEDGVTTSPAARPESKGSATHIGTMRFARPAAATAAGAPAFGTPSVGTPAVGTPAVGTPAVGTPAVGTPEGAHVGTASFSRPVSDSAVYSSTNTRSATASL